MSYPLLAALPEGVLQSLAPPLRVLLESLLRYRREVVEANLKRAFPCHSDQERSAIASGFYRHLSEVITELLTTPRLSEAALRERVRMPDLTPIERPLEAGERLLLLSLHQGNWEWLMQALSLQLGQPIDPVYKALHSPAAERFMRELRSLRGGRPLRIGEAARALLRSHPPHRPLGMLADQSPIASEDGLWQPFFGEPLPWHSGPERLARRSNAVVIFGHLLRTERGHYELKIRELARPPYDGLPPQAITRAYVRACEEAIRLQPESYLWSNRRWKRAGEVSASV
jgi:KDO2-lipid IV(A) lauroyltransferase